VQSRLEDVLGEVVFDVVECSVRLGLSGLLLTGSRLPGHTGPGEYSLASFYLRSLGLWDLEYLACQSSLETSARRTGDTCPLRAEPKAVDSLKAQMSKIQLIFGDQRRSRVYAPVL